MLFFLRDQLDYINTRHVHSASRLCRHQSFGSCVTDQLAESCFVCSHNYMCASLLRNPAIACTFMPYDRILEIHFNGGWLPADPSKGNVQPDCQGGWLAQSIGERLE